MSASFVDFLNFIVAHKDDDDYDPAAILDVFINFIEPFATENNIEVPDEFTQLMETICELDDEENNDDDASNDEESIVSSDEDNDNNTRESE